MCMCTSTEQILIAITDFIKRDRDLKLDVKKLNRKIDIKKCD